MRCGIGVDNIDAMYAPPDDQARTGQRHSSFGWPLNRRFDPFAGLTFPTADEDVDVFRLDETETAEAGSAE